jgi:hypothetical protein
LIPINIDNGRELAYLFRCSLGSFHIRYLGLPLHDRRMKCSDWGFLVDKFGKKLQNWKGQLISIGGRITLTNVVLLAIPLNTLSLYRIPKKIIKQIDKYRCQFLW